MTTIHMPRVASSFMLKGSGTLASMKYRSTTKTLKSIIKTKLSREGAPFRMLKNLLVLTVSKASQLCT